ncbi:MAG: HEAT repeat domain-containing protein [Gemmatimonadales bacterium]
MSPPRPPRPGRSGCDDDDDIRVAALNAMLQMDAERAGPILKSVLEKRDEASACLRRKAIFLVSQKRTAETEDILLGAARSDPDPEVRRQAVFWLSQVGTEKAVVALDSILRNSTDPELQEKAVFALSQHRSPRAAQALRGYAERRDVAPRIREQAIFWLSQHSSSENAAFLKALFPRLETDELKEKVLFSISQMRGDDHARWLLDVALDRGQTVEIRKKALFWAGQSPQLPIADLVRLYDRTDDREMREQLVFVYSQRREPEAVDKLLDIAKGDPDRELRKKALFWLGQSRDPRVAELLLQIINQSEP